MKDIELLIFENVKAALIDFANTCEENDAVPVIHVGNLMQGLGGRIGFDRQADLRAYLTNNAARLNMAGIGVKPLSNGRFQVYRSRVHDEGSAALTIEVLQSLADEHLAKAGAYLDALKQVEAMIGGGE